VLRSSQYSAYCHGHIKGLGLVLVLTKSCTFLQRVAKEDALILRAPRLQLDPKGKQPQFEVNVHVQAQRP